MDLNRLQYTKSQSDKDIGKQSFNVAKPHEEKKDKSLKITSSDYSKGEATIETRIVFVISGGDKRERDYFKMVMKDRNIRRLKIAFVSKKRQGLVPTQMFELAKDFQTDAVFVTETDRYNIDPDDTIYLVQDIDEFEQEIRGLLKRQDEVQQTKWIISNPSIETWLFYHKFDTPCGILDEGLDKPLNERSKWLKHKLDELVNGGMNPIEAFADIRTAIENSKANYRECNGLPDVYSTQMYILAEDILNTMGNEFDQMLQRRRDMVIRFMQNNRN